MNTVANNQGVVEVFTLLDDLNVLLQLNKRISGRKPSLVLSEAATISVIKSVYGIRTWKALYTLLTDRFTTEFTLPTYKSFVLLMNHYAQVILVLLNALFQLNQRQSGVIKFMDSTPLPVCKNYNIKRHKTMRGMATRSKGSLGWFYGLKLHAVTDFTGNLLHIKFTTGRVGDRKILDTVLEKLHHSILVADAGYTSKKLERKAAVLGNLFITGSRKNMQRLASLLDIRLLNSRSRIEAVFSILKERLGLITSLPRSVEGYLAHYIYVLFGYMMTKAIS